MASLLLQPFLSHGHPHAVAICRPQTSLRSHASKQRQQLFIHISHPTHPRVPAPTCQASVSAAGRCSLCPAASSWHQQTQQSGQAAHARCAQGCAGTCCGCHSRQPVGRWVLGGVEAGGDEWGSLWLFSCTGQRRRLPPPLLPFINAHSLTQAPCPCFLHIQHRYLCSQHNVLPLLVLQPC